jgi:hypothetical protein
MDIEVENKESTNQTTSNNLQQENTLTTTNEVSVTEEKQNSFLETTLGKAINGAIDIGLRWALPDLIENQVIDIKNSLLKNGLKEGINKSVEVALDFGKSAYGLVTGKFDNISQIQTAVQKGGIIDTISNSIDSVLKYTVKKDIIPSSIAKVIKSSKNTLLDNIETNLEKTMTEQIEGIENIDKAISNWNIYLKQENFEKMDVEYKKVKEQLDNLVPLESTLKKARELENLHLLIKNRGGDVTLSAEEKQLAQTLT